MSEIAHRTAHTLRSWASSRRYRFQAGIAQWRRAWRYATDRLSADDAQRMMLDCRYPAGWHPLMVLTVEDTLEQAREDLADHPELPRLVEDGCARVADKWESYNDELAMARRWAIDMAYDAAIAQGIRLALHEDEHRSST